MIEFFLHSLMKKWPRCQGLSGGEGQGELGEAQGRYGVTFITFFCVLATAL